MPSDPVGFVLPSLLFLLSEEYLRHRNDQMRTKNLAAQMLLAERRGELIEKRLVERQAAFLLLSLRQRILAVPDQICRRILNLSDPAQARSILREAMISLLSELKDLPQAVTDPNWLKKLRLTTESKGIEQLEREPITVPF
jgi:hypothetical protein